MGDLVVHHRRLGCIVVEARHPLDSESGVLFDLSLSLGLGLNLRLNLNLSLRMEVTEVDAFQQYLEPVQRKQAPVVVFGFGFVRTLPFRLPFALDLDLGLILAVALNGDHLVRSAYANSTSQPTRPPTQQKG